MRRPLLALALCGACVAPATLRPTPPFRPSVRVGIDHSQTATGLATSYDPFIRAAVAALDRGDPLRAWRLVRDPDAADVVVRHTPEPLGSNRLGVETDGEDSVYIDPVAASGPMVMQTVVAHELMHAAGAQHVCREPRELPDRTHPHETCSPVGFGRAVVNPYVFYAADDPGCDPFRSVCPGMSPQSELTDLDRAELRRGYPRRNFP